MALTSNLKPPRIYKVQNSASRLSGNEGYQSRSLFCTCHNPMCRLEVVVVVMMGSVWAELVLILIGLVR